MSVKDSKNRQIITLTALVDAIYQSILSIASSSGYFNFRFNAHSDTQTLDQ